MAEAEVQQLQAALQRLEKKLQKTREVLVSC